MSTRRLLVIAEVAVAIVLLAGSGLMIRSLAKLLAVSPGVDPRQVLTFRITVADGAFQPDSFPAYFAQLADGLGSLPGVQVAGLSDCIPLSGGCNSTSVKFLDRPAVADASTLPDVDVVHVTAGWFAAMRVPLKRGRLLTDADRRGRPNVVLISEAAAREFWPNADPIGKRIELGPGVRLSAEVVGIVGDVRSAPESPAKSAIYISYLQSEQWSIQTFIRTSGDPLAIVAPARRAMYAIAPNFPVYDVQLMTTRVAAATARARFSAGLLAIFAAVALVLAVVGIYGVMSFAVAQRTREIGIRMALGAERRDVLRGVVLEGLGLAAAGAAVGLAAALAFVRVLQALLFDVRPSDPATYVTIIAILGAAAAAASWIPARRATRVDPTEALRYD